MADESTQTAGSQPLSIPEFAAKIKARDPRLANVADDVLARKVFERRPELMKFVQTSETRAGHERVGEKGVVGGEDTSKPGAFDRFGQAVGVPTSGEGVKTFVENSPMHPPKDMTDAAITGAKLVTGAAPVIEAGKAAINYGKLLYDTATKMAGTAKSSYEDVTSGKKSFEEGAKDVNQAESDFLLKGLTSIMGGNAVANGIEDVKGQNWKGLAGDALGFAALMYMMKPGRNKSITDLPPKDLVRMDEHLASLIADVGDTYSDRATLAGEVRPLLRQAIQERGWTDQHMDPGPIGNKGKFPSRIGPGPLATDPVPQFDAAGKPTGTYASNIREGARNVLKTVDAAVDIANRPFERVIGEYGSTVAKDSVKKPISSTLRAQAADYLKVHDTGLANALTGLADTIDHAKTLGDLDAIKVHANKEMQNLASATPGEAIGATAQTAYAYKLAAEAIRTTLYPALEEASGINLAKFGAREHAAIGLRDGVYTTYLTRVDPIQASEASRGYLAGILHGSKYTRHMLERMLRLNPMEAGDFGSTFRKGVGPIGEGTTGEAIKTVGKKQLRLSGSTKPTQFTISAGVPEEIVTGGSGAEPQMSYAGQQEVPNAQHEPIEGGSRSRQRLELGTTEGTIPESVFKRSKSKIRQDEIGESQTSTPDRSVAGEPSKTQSRWQYLTGAKGPTQTVSTVGPGVMTTSSPEIAYATLKRLRAITERQDFMNLPFAKREMMRDAVASLDKQLRDYTAYKGQKAPRKTVITPAKPGIIRPSSTGKAAAIAGQLNQEAHPDEVQPQP